MLFCVCAAVVSLRINISNALFLFQLIHFGGVAVVAVFVFFPYFNAKLDSVLFMKLWRKERKCNSTRSSLGVCCECVIGLNISSGRKTTKQRQNSERARKKHHAVHISFVNAKKISIKIRWRLCVWLHEYGREHAIQRQRKQQQEENPSGLFLYRSCTTRSIITKHIATCLRTKQPTEEEKGRRSEEKKTSWRWRWHLTGQRNDTQIRSRTAEITRMKSALCAPRTDYNFCESMWQHKHSQSHTHSLCIQNMSSSSL